MTLREAQWLGDHEQVRETWDEDGEGNTGQHMKGLVGHGREFGLYSKQYFKQGSNMIWFILTAERDLDSKEIRTKVEKSVRRQWPDSGDGEKMGKFWNLETEFIDGLNEGKREIKDDLIFCSKNWVNTGAISI